MYRPIPDTLKKFAKAHPDRIEKIECERDEFRGDRGSMAWSYWVYLKPGWILPGHETHQIHEGTIAEIKSQFQLIRKCDCDECLQLIAEEATKAA
jgi:hypothetical protein